MIKINSLRIEYDEITAVKDLSLEIKKGQIFGLVGPNGAGKTSTIKALAGILEPTYGEILIDGVDLELETQRALQSIGYMPDFAPVYENLKVWEYLDVFASAYLLNRELRKSRIDEWITRVNLRDKRDTYIKELSRGMRQRLVLAKTLLHDPKVLLLDEPASGLDPSARREMREILKSVAKENKAIIISSHILTELDDFCNSIGIMQKGMMVVSGSLEEIRAKVKTLGLLTIRLSEKSQDLANKILQFLSNSKLISNLQGVTLTEYKMNFQGDETQCTWLLDQLIKHEIPIYEFFLERPNIEDIFFQIGAKEVS
ncbi:MAG: ABC transporter ATP-binding protein [Candidatus Omnitrophica bacterium]|nr:ABC transporter ATP-binding protein [Candidatus Omnitrophota bacterium]